MTLAPGIYPQIYRGKVPGSTHAARMAVLAPKIAEFASLGAKGIAWHGFSQELDIDAMRDLTAMCRANGLKSLAAYGMDSSDPAGKGERIGRVLASDLCDGVLLDAEGAWEDTADGDDKAHARAFAAAFMPYRRAVPDKPVADQPWMLPTVHWSAFPWEEFADVVDARAPQWYYNDFAAQYGRSRVTQMGQKCAVAWDKLNARLAATGHARPLWSTIQGYGWDDITGDLRAILNGTALVPTFVWCEPLPSAHFMSAWRQWASTPHAQ